MHKARRRRRASALAALTLLAAVALVPASGAARTHGSIPRALEKQHQTAGVNAREEGEDSDAAEEVMARAEFENAIEAAPALKVPAGALAAGLRHASALGTTGGRWHALTDRPYLNDPVPGYGPEGFSDWGVGHKWVTGRITALAASGKAVYAGGADGGVWKSTDRGVHWRVWSNGLPRYSIGALETNPRDGSVWAGLGEANTNFDGQAAFGIYRLAPGAHRWHRVGGRELRSRGVFYIRFIKGRAYAATQQGLYRHAGGSTSGSWELLLAPDPVKNPYRNMVTDVIAVPGTNGNTILANLGWRGGTDPNATQLNGFYVSTQGGAAGTFHRITPTGDINAAEIGRVSFSGTFGRGPLYAVVEDSASVSLLGEGVFVSPNGDPAGPWNLVADFAKLANSGSALSPDPNDYFPGIQAWYNQYIKVDPRNPQHAYLGLEEVFETRNGGRTWFAIGAYWNYDIACSQDNEKPYNCPQTTHADQHAITFSHGQVYAGGDGGIWRRSMRAHGRPGWVNLNPTLHTLQYYSAAVGQTPHGDVVYGGLQDNGASLLMANGHLVNQFTGDGGDTIVDPRNGTRVLNEYVYLDVTLSTDFGRHDVEISPSCLTATEPPDPCDENPQFISPMERDPKNASHFVIAGQYVWESWKGWRTRCSGSQCDWKISHDVGAAGPAESTTALGVSGHTTYAGWCTGPGGACNPGGPTPFGRGISTNVGGAWHELNVSGLPNRYITSLVVDPRNPRHVYATFGSYSRRWIDGSGFGHVWESRDGGETWRNTSGNLPDVPAHRVVIWGGRLVVATDVGVFTSRGGTSWKRLGRALPPARVWDLYVAPSGRYLVAATHGRGQWAIARP
jgi:hypothetical protein